MHHSTDLFAKGDSYASPALSIALATLSIRLIHTPPTFRPLRHALPLRKESRHSRFPDNTCILPVLRPDTRKEKYKKPGIPAVPAAIYLCATCESKCTTIAVC